MNGFVILVCLSHPSFWDYLLQSTHAEFKMELKAESNALIFNKLETKIKSKINKPFFPHNHFPAR